MNNLNSKFSCVSGSVENMERRKIVFITLWFLLFLVVIKVWKDYLGTELEREFSNKSASIISEPVYGENNILFVETSCMLNYKNKAGIILNPRQACAVESAARSNPQAKIYVLHTCPVKRTDIQLSPEYVLRVLVYPNVYIWPFYNKMLLFGTPFQHWPKLHFQSNLFEFVHASDIVKFVALWKYAGTYFDLDYIVMKSIGEMKNFASVEDSKSISTGVLNFAPDELGRNVCWACLTELKDPLYGNVLRHRGVDAITRVFQLMCKKMFVGQIAPGHCQGFIILTFWKFSPIPSWKWWQYFDEKFSRDVMEDISNSLAVHMWERKSQGLAVKVKSSQPYALIAQQYCPAVYSHSGEEF